MSEVHLTVLDVGHGSAVVVSGPDGHVLIDGGPGPWVLRYLRDQGIKHLAGVAVTHTDEDHLRGVAALLDSREFTFGTVRLNSDAQKETELWEAVAFSFDQLSRRAKVDWQLSLAVGDDLPPVASDVQIEVLAPSRYLASKGPGSTDRDGRALSANSVSSVLRILIGGDPRLLVAADVDDVGLANMLDGQDVRAPVLVFPHHGGHVRARATSAQDAAFARQLCAAVQPDLVIFSQGRGRYGNPRPAIVDAVRESCGDVRIACTQLSEGCSDTRPPADGFTHLLDLPARGRDYEDCCAGTLRIPLRGPVGPSMDSHEAFKDKYATTAVCRRQLLLTIAASPADPA